MTMFFTANTYLPFEDISDAIRKGLNGTAHFYIDYRESHRKGGQFNNAAEVSLKQELWLQGIKKIFEHYRKVQTKKRLIK
jgi:hypothetical protein